MPEMLTKAEREQLDAFVKEINWNDPYCPKRRAFATKVKESVLEDIYTQDLVPLMADIRNFGPGEEIQFATTEGLVAYVIEPGSFAPRSQLTQTVTTLPKKTITVATELDINQVRSGRYGTVSDIKKKALEQILGARNAMLWKVAYQAVTSSTTNGNYATVASGATTATKKAAIDTALTYLDDYTSNGAKAIIGRFSSLSFFEDLDYQTLPDSMREDIYKRTGLLGYYKNVPVVRLKSFKDPYGVQLISANYILVIGEGVLKFGVQDPGLEVYENFKGTTTRSIEWAWWQDLGACAVESHRIYEIQIT